MTHELLQNVVITLQVMFLTSTVAMVHFKWYKVALSCALAMVILGGLQLWIR